MKLLQRVGYSTFSSGQILQSISSYQQCIEKDPLAYDLIDGLGCIQDQEGYYQHRIFRWFEQKKEDGEIKGTPYDALSLCYSISKAYEEGINWYNKMIKKYSNLYQLHFGLGNIYYSRGQYDHALIQYQKVLQLRPEFDKGYQVIANVHYFKKDNKIQAKFYASRALELNEKNYYAYFIYQMCSDKDPRQKMNRLAEILNIWKQFCIPYNGIAQIFSQINDQASALQFYELSLKINPHYDHTYYLIANSYIKRGKLSKGFQNYRKAIKLNPNNQLFNFALGKYYLEQSLLPLAILTFEKTIKINPKNPRCYYFLGKAYYLTQQSERGLAEFKKCMSFTPRDFQLHMQLRSFFLSRKLFKDAKQFYLQLIQKDPQFYINYHSLGVIYKQMNLITQALSQFKNCLMLNPSSYDLYKNLGDMYYEKDEQKSAIFWYQRYLQHEKNQFDVYLKLGNCESTLRNYKDAIDWYIEADKIDTTNCLLNYNFGLVYINIKEFYKAAQKFKKCLKSDTKKLWHNAKLKLKLCYQKMENINLIKFYENQLKEDDKNIQLYIRLGKLYIKNRQYDLALTPFENAKNLLKYCDTQQKQILYKIDIDEFQGRGNRSNQKSQFGFRSNRDRGMYQRDRKIYSRVWEVEFNPPIDMNQIN